MSFIQCCKDKVYGPKVYVSLTQIISFEKYVKIVPNEQWYLIITTDGSQFYTLYDFTSLITYHLPNF